ncbi:putative endonuclease lcl3 [Ascosphaera atra]|nr:putative endonuclease lcl3 [Ascosphaera atra]
MTRWPFNHSSPEKDEQDSSNSSSPTRILHHRNSNDDTDHVNAHDRHHDSSWGTLLEPSNLIATAVLTTSILSAAYLYRNFLRRIPDANSVELSWFRKRSLLGYVTSVGDGDNFRMFHTPGGVLAGWGWARKVPEDRKELKGRTLHVRLAGVDAPELAHFGNPSQPYGAEALSFLKSYVLHRRVRAYIHRPDQYQRVVATVYVNRLPWPLHAVGLPLPFWVYGRDVGLQMLRRGLATVYEARFGAEFGGDRMEKKYRRAEWWAQWWRKGMWALKKNAGKKKGVGFFETPREFKTRMAAVEGKGEAARGFANGSPRSHTTEKSHHNAKSSKMPGRPSNGNGKGHAK